jgi:hypothetical protein
MCFWVVPCDYNKLRRQSHERPQIAKRDRRIRSDESTTGEATSENTRHNVEEQSEERLVPKAHNWRHDRFNLHYICVSSGADGTDCPGCGAIVTFEEVTAIDKTSQSAAERLVKVNQLWSQKYGR